ncbi:MAG: hypothetical protein JW838_15715 [Spirochaetes bacterium]|nr:hypothetical protein [Spirochaetota bacterium]
MNKSLGRILIAALLLSSFSLMSCKSDGYSSDDDEGLLSLFTLQRAPFSVSGSIQKGPFIAGSAITIYELDDDLSQNGLSYITTTVDDFGLFSYPREIQSRYAEIIAEGYYYNEVAGGLSDSELRLSAIADLARGETVNVNILTTLAKERIKYLITEEGKSFTLARKQAHEEVLAIFNIADSTVSFERMDISETGDANAMLLAISASFQGDNSVAELSELIAHVSLDIREDGILDNQAYLDEITGNAFTLDCFLVGEDLKNRYISLGLPMPNIPDMEPVMKNILAPRDMAYSWTKTFGGVHDEHGRGVTIDNIGNIYVTGYFRGPSPVNFAADWGGTDIKTPVTEDRPYAFITKINSNGSYGWTRMIGNGAVDGDYNDGGHCVSTDSNGNVYVSGNFRETVNFAEDWGGSDFKTASGYSGAFLMKINSDGTYGWTRFLGSGGSAIAYHVMVGASDVVYVSGGASGTVNFAADWGGADSKTMSSRAFVTKIDADGGYLWTKTIGSGMRSSMTLDSNGNIYVTGYFLGTSSINFAEDWGQTDTKSRITSAYADVYVAKINSNATYGWTKIVGTGLQDPDMSSSRKIGITTDEENNVYVSDGFRGTDVNFAADWGGSDLKTSNGSEDAFVLKITSSGAYGWTRVFGGINRDYANALVTDNAGGLYVAGRFTDAVRFGKDWGGFDSRSSSSMSNPGDGFLMKIGIDGSYGWTRVIQWNVRNMVMDNQGSLLLVGGFEGKVNFPDDLGGTDIKESRQSDIFVVKLSIREAGAIVPGNTYGWTKVINASNFSHGYDVVTDSSGNVYFAGLFSGSAVNFAGDWGGVDERSTLSWGVPFVTKVFADGSYAWTRVFPRSSGNGVVINKIAVDGESNVYAIGNILGNVNLADDWGEIDIRSSAGSTDYCIVKINSNGTYGWSQIIGGTDYDYGRDVSVDGAGNIYLLGVFSSPSVDFAADWGGSDVKTLASTVHSEAALTKLSAAGDYLWTKTLAVDELNYLSITIDPINSLLIAGSFNGTVNFAEAWGGTDSLTAGSVGGDIFITKIFSSGSYGWTKKIGSTKGEGAEDIVTDKRGNIYITGFYQSPLVNFGAAWQKIDKRSLVGTSNAFVTKINSDGTYGWTRTWGNFFSWGRGVAVDTTDTVYLTGFFQDTDINFARDFGLADLHSTAGSNGRRDVYFMRINRDGTYGWTKTFGGASSSASGDDEGVALGIGNNNRVYLTGTIGGASDVNFASGWGINDIESSSAYSKVFLQMINP